MAATTTSRSSAADVGLPPVRVGPILLTGYGQFDGLFPLGAHEVSQTGTFRVRRARVFASAELTPNIAFMIGADAVQTPVPLLDVYLTLRFIKAVNIRAGQFVAPYGIERMTSSKDLEAIDRVLDPFVPGRDMGVMVFNGTPFRGGLSYFAAVINGAGSNTRDSNDQKDLIGRVAWRLPSITGLSIAANAQTGRQPLGTRKRWGADATFERGPYRVVAEYAHETHDEWGTTSAHGFYLLARRRFTPAAPRPDFFMAEAVVRFVDIQDPRKALVPAYPFIRGREVQAGGNYYFSQNVRLMGDVFVPTDHQAGAPRGTIVFRAQFMF